MSIVIRLLLLCAIAGAMPLIAPAQDRWPAVPPQAREGFDPDPLMQMERHDFGVPPTRRLHHGPMHGPTPASVPGGQVITTRGLLALVQGRQVPYVIFDVLGQPQTLPAAVPAAWLAQSGGFDAAAQQQAEQLFGQLTRGRKDIALVFYCLSRECWMSYNASLRAIHAGYTNVLWYRGGIEAWKMAGMAVQSASPGYGPTQGSQVPQTAQPPAQPAAPPAAPPPLPAVEARATFTPVMPRVRESAVDAAAAPAGGELRIGQGRFFSFALPPGWRVGEDGQFALTLLAPQNDALTLMVGNAGLPLNHPPARFAYDKLSALQPQNLQIGALRQGRPAVGFRDAVEFEVSYWSRGVAYRGFAKVSVAPAYDSSTMALTAALSAADRWAGYSSWLPQVAEQVAATDGAAFGMRGIMQQNLQNSAAFGEAARRHREWSQANWQQVTDERNASQDRRNFAVRENLGGVQTFANPFGTSQPLELPTSHRYYWTDPQGRVVGTDDPSADPNRGSTGEWRRMERVAR